MALVIVIEDIVGFLDGLELDLGFLSFRFGNFVGMVGEGGLLSVRYIVFIPGVASARYPSLYDRPSGHLPCLRPARLLRSLPHRLATTTSSLTSEGIIIYRRDQFQRPLDINSSVSANKRKPWETSREWNPTYWLTQNPSTA